MWNSYYEMIVLLNVFIHSTWCQTAHWRMHFGHIWHRLWGTTTICCVVFSQNLISALQFVSTSTTYRSPRPVSLAITKIETHCDGLIETIESHFSLSNISASVVWAVIIAKKFVNAPKLKKIKSEDSISMVAFIVVISLMGFMILILWSYNLSVIIPTNFSKALILEAVCSR